MLYVRRHGEAEVHPVVLWDGATVKDLLQVLGLQRGRWLGRGNQWCLVPLACPVTVFRDSGLAGTGTPEDPYTVEVPAASTKRLAPLTVAASLAANGMELDGEMSPCPVPSEADGSGANGSNAKKRKILPRPPGVPVTPNMTEFLNAGNQIVFYELGPGDEVDQSPLQPPIQDDDPSKPHRCSYCDRRFGSVEGCKKHMRIKHSRHGRRVFVCPLLHLDTGRPCKKQLPTSDAMSYHKRFALEHHTKDEWKFACSNSPLGCDKRFPRFLEQKRHEKACKFGKKDMQQMADEHNALDQRGLDQEGLSDHNGGVSDHNRMSDQHQELAQSPMPELGDHSQALVVSSQSINVPDHVLAFAAQGLADPTGHGLSMQQVALPDQVVVSDMV